MSELSTFYHAVPQEINEKAQFKYIRAYSVEDCLKWLIVLLAAICNGFSGAFEYYMWIAYNVFELHIFYIFMILFTWTESCIHGCIMYICVYLILCQVRNQYKFVSEWLLYHFLSFFLFPIFLFRAAWEKGVIKAQAQNVARNLADTPANLMTPTIFAQVSFMPTYSYTGVSFNTVLQVLQVCYVYTCHTSSLM
jgi:hypothetical protein